MLTVTFFLNLWYPFLKLIKFFYLLYSATVAHPHSLPLFCPPPECTLPLSLFRKEHASRGYLQSMGYQVEVGLSSSPSFKVGRGDPALGTAKVLGIALLPLPGLPQVDQVTLHHTYAEGLDLSHPGSLSVHSL